MQGRQESLWGAESVGWKGEVTAGAGGEVHFGRSLSGRRRYMEPFRGGEMALTCSAVTNPALCAAGSWEKGS